MVIILSRASSPRIRSFKLILKVPEDIKKINLDFEEENQLMVKEMD